MKKIISLFQRNYEGDRLVRNEIVPGAEWVINGEGVATRKYDGTCCLVKDGKLFRRFEVKPGKKAPENFMLADFDEVTGKQQGWVPVGDSSNDQYHREAFALDTFVDGTYELCGPNVQDNPEGFERHVLVQHSLAEKLNCPRDFFGIRYFFFSLKTMLKVSCGIILMDEWLKLKPKTLASGDVNESRH